jgi:PAS domain S-box-containing protein
MSGKHVMNIRNMGMRPKLIVINSLFVIFLIGALIAVFLQYSKKELLENLEHDSLSFSTHFAYNSTLALLSKNRETVERYIDGLLKNSEVVYGALYYSDGTLFIEKSKEEYKEYEPLEIKGGNGRSSTVREQKHGVYSIIEASSPVLLERVEGGREEIGLLSDILSTDELMATEAEVLGFAVVALSAKRPMERFFAASLKWMIIAILLSTVVVIMISIAISRFMTPIINLSVAAERVAGGDLEVAIASSSRDEVGTMAAAFNDMVGSLKSHITEIKESQREIEAIFDGITDYIWVVASDCTMLRANRMFAEKVGMSVQEIIGKKCEDIIFPGGSFCRIACPMYGRGVTVVPGSSDATEFRDEENARTYQMRTFPLIDSSDDLRGGINYLKDITETKMMETHLIQSEKLAATGRLAADVAHEVNNPLGIIKNYITMLKRGMGKKDSEMIESLDIINEEISRIAEIIKGLLVFSRPDSKDEELVDINEITKAIVSLVSNSMKKHAIEFDMELDSSIPEIRISAGHLKQVLINLINNSFDAMPGGGKLFLKTYDRKDGIAIELEDNGIGIREEDIKELFTPFYTTKGVKGTGLGLAISYGIVKGYGGDISLKSKEKGVLARIFLPYKDRGAYYD